VADGPPEAELALLLAGTRHRREADAGRIRLLAAGMDEFAFAAVLAEQRMLLLAGTRLAAVAHDVLPPGFEARLAEAHAQARRGALLFAAAARHLADALEAAGIPGVELKGAALAADLHGDEALRAYTDIDLLVPAECLERAAAIAGSLGWTARVDPSGPALPPLHLALRHPQGALPEVELHWRIHWYEPRFAAAALARSRVVDGLRRLEPVDQLAALLLFYARDGFAGLRLAADLGAWWDRHGDAATPAALERLGQAHPELGEAWRAALTTVAPVVGLPAGAAPSALRPRSRRGALARRLRNWDLRGDTDQVHANVTLVDGLLTPRPGLGAFARRHVLVPASYLTDVYGVAPDASVRASSWRAWHAAKTGARYALALWGLRRGRSWSPLPASAGPASTPVPSG
jgi:Uncharacterised nucleotidyltransferase